MYNVNLGQLNMEFKMVKKLKNLNQSKNCSSFAMNTNKVDMLKTAIEKSEHYMRTIMALTEFKPINNSGGSKIEVATISDKHCCCN